MHDLGDNVGGEERSGLIGADALEGGVVVVLVGGFLGVAVENKVVVIGDVGGGDGGGVRWWCEESWGVCVVVEVTDVAGFEEAEAVLDGEGIGAIVVVMFVVVVGGTVGTQDKGLKEGEEFPEG